MGTGQGLHQKLAEDGTLAVWHNLMGEHCLFDHLGVDLDRARSLCELLLAIHHEVVDGVEEVTKLTLVLSDNIWKQVEELPHH